MKMHIAFDMPDLERALSLAHSLAEYADAFEIGLLLIYKYGEQAIKEFKKKFPQKTLIIDSKIIDHGKESALLFAEAGADWITVMAGTPTAIIRAVCSTAAEKGKKVMLDLLDVSSLGQAALEAESLGIDALLLHMAPQANEEIFLDTWEIVRGNSPLPIFIASYVTRETLPGIIALNPAGLIVGRAIVQSTNPLIEAKHFDSLIHSSK